jgi:glycine/D-amino acid oxidase-like deaminating enzyme
LPKAAVLRKDDPEWCVQKGMDSMTESVWRAQTALPSFPRLKRDCAADVLVIGGGIAGLLCAYMLKQSGANVLLAEGGRICGGVTGDTTAKITAQHGLVYAKLLRRFGPERAGLYLRANLDALEKYRELCPGMDCDFETRDSYVYTLDRPEKIAAELEALRRLGYPAEASDAGELPFPTAGAVKFPAQAQFNPLAFLSSIAERLSVFEDTFITEIRDGAARTADGHIIRAEQYVVATHFPFLNKHGSYFLKLYQQRSYVLALENAPPISGMYLDERNGGLSFREYKDLLLLGGGGHRTGKQGGGWEYLRGAAARYYPAALEKYRFATQDCMSLDGMPYVGRYSAGTTDLYVATGFNKWGMTTAMAAAGILDELLQGRRDPYGGVFSPSRSILRPQLLCNGAEAVVNLLTPTAPRCPHLGCALKWNRMEHTWDCPCHGSRFEEDGGLLDNPATGDLKR